MRLPGHSIEGQTSILPAPLDDLPNFPDRDLNRAVVLADEGLRWLAPTAVQQRDGGGHARGVAGAVLTDPGQNLDCDLRVRPRQGANICRCSGHLAWGLPLLLIQAS